MRRGLGTHISSTLLDHHTSRNTNFDQSRSTMPDARSPNKETLPKSMLVIKKLFFRYFEYLLFLGALSQFSLIKSKKRKLLLSHLH